LDRRLVGFTVCLALLTALAFSHQHSQQSPPLPVIHPPRARAKEAPLFVFQQLTPSAVDEQA